MVVVVVHRHPDVVQHARRPQQFPLLRVAFVQAHARQLVEHAERERRHVLRVGAVHAVARREVLHRGAAHVLEQRGHVGVSWVAKRVAQPAEGRGAGPLFLDR